MALLPPQLVPAVIQASEQALAIHADIMWGIHADHATGLVMGLLTPAEVLDFRASDGVDMREIKLRKAVGARVLLQQLAQALLITGHFVEAARAYELCADMYVRGGLQGEMLRESARVARPIAAANREADKSQREVYRFWADAALKHEGIDAATRVHALGVERGVWPSALQRPVGQYASHLEARPFWEAASLPAALALQAAYPQIKAELLSLLSGMAGGKAVGGGKAGSGKAADELFAPYKSDTLKKGSWTDYQFFAGCRRDERNCERCPATARAIASRDELNSLVCGAHFFSRLKAGTHIGAHCGPSNLRLRVHLGLLVPEGCKIRVGDQVRLWREGECLVFDDSFEHEVWHEGSGERVVLICDCWHPSLNVEREIVPMLSPDERTAFMAARCGRHEPLTERHYTTGKSVKR